MENSKLDYKMTILVVEDSGFMMKNFVRSLNQMGFENILQAVNGNDGIQKLKDNDVDLIISDWNMPERDGLSFLKYVRMNQKTENIPFIMATAQGDMGKKEEANKEGATNHIAKPFTKDQLHEKIEEVFGLVKETKPEIKPRKVTNGKVQIRIAHIQITDHLALGVLKHQIETMQVKPKYFDLETQCIAGWNPIEKALGDGTVDAAFVLAPIAMDLFAYNVPIKLVSLAHKNGSIFVRSARHSGQEHINLDTIYTRKVINIPHKMSVHNMLAHKFLTELGLRPGVPGDNPDINVFFEVVPPIQMPSIMKENEDVAGFIVAEPIGSNAINKGIAELQFLSASLWKDHPCCVVVFQEDFIAKHTDAVYEFASLLVKAGRFADSNKDKAAEIAVPFLDPAGKLGLTKEILHGVLTEPLGITLHDLYPKLDDLDTMQRYMKEKMGIGKLIDLEKFVDIRFADVVC